MEADERPPTLHKVKPHHIGLCTLLFLLFHGHKNTLSPAFRAHMYRLVLSEVSEVSQPKTCQQLVDAMSAGPRSESGGDDQIRLDFQTIDQAMKDIESLNSFFLTLPDLFQDKGYLEGSSAVYIAPLARRSIFGYFVRRCCMSYFKLDLNGISKLHKAYLAWMSGKEKEGLRLGYEPIPKDMEAQDTVYKTDPDRHPWARADPYDVFEAAQATGDEYVASESLRRFFEQHFHILSDSGYRQQALLNLARMHYIRKQYVAARDLLDETVMLSRTSGDRITLQHAIALLHRLPPENPGELPMLSEVQPCINPQEILFDVSKLLKPESEQPLSVAFERIFEGIGTYDHWTDVQRILGSEGEQWGQHAVQSIVWKEAGCEMLASIEESIVMAFTEHSSDDTTRLTVTLNRAYRRAKDGAYEEAITTLLEPSVWRGLSVDDFGTWSNEIWHICMLEATRNGQDRICRDYLLNKRPPGEYDPTNFSLHATSPVKNMIRDKLYKVVQMRECEQGTTVVKELLEALWHCEFQGRHALYRIAVILLADIGLEFGMMNWSKKILEEILPQLLICGDRETKAYGYVTYGRCILAVGKTDSTTIRGSLQYFKESECDYLIMGMWSCVQDVRYILSRIYNQLGMPHERDEMATAHRQAVEMMKAKGRQPIDTTRERLWDVITQIGVGLASRQMDPTRRN